LWSFGEEVYDILRSYLFIRERLRPYIDELAATAAQSGAPIIRPLFWEFSKDPLAWDIEDQFMFGPDILVAPVLEEGGRRRSVYLPAGTTWTDVWSGSTYDGECTVDSEAPLATIPVFARNGAERWFTE
jgi:alpha-D-xyloside xylohydrolase